MLGYSKSFSSTLIGMWSSGTGLAGIFGSGFFLALSALKLSEFWVLIIRFRFLFQLLHFYLYIYIVFNG